jgi:hypothetical protein
MAGTFGDSGINFSELLKSFGGETMVDDIVYGEVDFYSETTLQGTVGNPYAIGFDGKNFGADPPTIINHAEFTSII